MTARRLVIRHIPRIERRLCGGGNLRGCQNEPIRQRLQLRSGNRRIDCRDGVFPQSQASCDSPADRIGKRQPAVRAQQFPPRRTEFARDKHRASGLGQDLTMARDSVTALPSLSNQSFERAKIQSGARATAVATSSARVNWPMFSPAARRTSRSTRNNEDIPISRHTASAADPRPTPRVRRER